VLAGLRRDDLQPAAVSLDDFLADGQAQSQPDAARGVNGDGAFPAASAVNPAPLSCTSICTSFPPALLDSGLQAHANQWRLGIGLERVEHDFGQRVL